MVTRGKSTKTSEKKVPQAASKASSASADFDKNSIEGTATPRISAISGVSANVKVLELGAGLYSLRLTESRAAKSNFLGMVMPATYITGTPTGQTEILAPTAGQAGWLGPEGGTIAVRVPADGGQLWITTYRTAEQEAVPVEIQVTRLDRPQPGAPSVLLPSSPNVGQTQPQSAFKPAAREIKLEIILHIERLGDRTFPSGKWTGNQKQKRRIEAFGIRPLELLSPQDIEYKAFGPNGRETTWVSDAKLCGTRGQGMPLTGFAIRLGSRLKERYDILYEGAFFDGGISSMSKNGETCTSTRPDDPLEDINIHLVERF